MATANPFDLLGDDENDDPSQLIAVQQQKIAAKKPAAPAAVKFPTKPAPPSQAARETRSSAAPTRGGVGRGGPGRGRGGRGGGTGPNRDFGNGNANGFSGGYGGGGGGGGGVEGDAGRLPERDRGPRPPFRGGRRGGYGNGEAGGESEQPPRRMYERRSGTGRGYEMKREGSGRGNWGTATDDVIAQATEENVNVDDKILASEKQPEHDDVPSSEAKKDKDAQANEAEEKEPEDKEMTLEEYEKIREEKRKALLALKTEERKVEIDQELQSMQQLSLKKRNDDVFMKLGSDKDTGKKKDVADRDERAKKPVSINEFLKPAEGERYYSPVGRGRGRARGDRGPFRGGFGGGRGSGAPAAAPSIEDPGQFPTLGK
ncbi:RGG repeats nuclear RNA binding protein A-like [Phoenix dactylifera]|uniref:RGG repeats nuclear RNA binding protein A-like n=1 Tax=Phoenix dactylifera TaxID=42345 RepID=A0A8B7D0F0_PHODC|nr:RGG repeats nuclear RNA binding protein A-like [Phoenix dactylifera]